jgi:hypothetical protein
LDKVTVRLIDVIENIDRASELIKANWEESGNPFDVVIEDVKSFYKRMSEVGQVITSGAYIMDDMVGYCIASITPHPLNFSIRVCNVDGIYLIPKLRGGVVATRLLHKIRLVAKGCGVDLMHYHAPAGSDYSNALGARFTPVSNYFREVLVYDA